MKVENASVLARVMIVGAAGVMAVTALAISSRANAAVSYSIAGETGKECYNAKVAWKLFKAAQTPGGTDGAKVTPLPPTDPFAMQCAADARARRASAPKKS